MHEIPIRCVVLTKCWKGAPQLSKGEHPHLGQCHRTTLVRPVADELSWSGPSANDVGSAVKGRVKGHAVVSHGTQPSRKAHPGVFLVLRTENTMTQVVRVFKKGGHCLTRPTHTPSLTNPQPKLRAVPQPPLPGRCPRASLAKTQGESPNQRNGV